VSPDDDPPGGPSHPTGRAALVLIGVTLLIVALALMSTFNGRW
jgi:hypothetical protein